MWNDDEAAARNDVDMPHTVEAVDALPALGTPIAAYEMPSDEYAREKRALYDAFVAAGHHPEPWDLAAHVGTIVDVACDTLVLHVGRGRFMYVPAIEHAALCERERAREAHTRSVR